MAEVTGHKSLTALRQYEWTTETQYQAVGQSIAHMEEFKAVCAASKDVDVRTLHAERARKVGAVAQEVQKSMINGNLHKCNITFNF